MPRIPTLNSTPLPCHKTAAGYTTASNGDLTSHIDAATAANQQGFVVKFQEDENHSGVSTRWLYNTQASGPSTDYYALTPSADGSSIAAVGCSQRYSLVSKIDAAAGGLSWSQKIDTSSPSGWPPYLYSVVPCPDSGFMAAGSFLL